MRIENMKPEHVAQVAYLETVCFHDPWSEKSIGEELGNDLALWLVAVENDVVIGYVGSQTVLGWTDIMNVAVSPEHRRKGVAEKLLREKGFFRIGIQTTMDNLPARALYRKMGYSERADVGSERCFCEKTL